MGAQRVGRRQVLRGAGAAAGGLAVVGLGAAVPASAADEAAGDISGSWLADVHNADGSTVVGVLSFAGGGVALVHDISPAGPPWTGTWERRGDAGLRATLWTGFPGEGGPGTVGGTARLRLRARLDDGRLVGTFTFAVFDPTGAQVQAGSGTFRARPIEA
jgi:hypothetical protein